MTLDTTDGPGTRLQRSTVWPNLRHFPLAQLILVEKEKKKMERTKSLIDFYLKIHIGTKFPSFLLY